MTAVMPLLWGDLRGCRFVVTAWAMNLAARMGYGDRPLLHNSRILLSELPQAEATLLLIAR